MVYRLACKTNGDLVSYLLTSVILSVFHISEFSRSNLAPDRTTTNEELKQHGDTLVEKVQTGEFADQNQVQVVSLSVSDPIPPPVDPTGGVRATNETGMFK